MLAQHFKVEAGAALRLRFQARTVGVKREGKQFNNCYIGLASYDAAGKRLTFQVRDLFETDWEPGQLAVVLPSAATKAELILFLSKTGALQVRNLILARRGRSRARL